MTEPRPDSAMDYLQADHRRLDGLMGECQAKARAGEMGTAGEVFARFRDGLVRHIKIEEGLLFPVFEKATGLPKTGGPTGVMRQEHEEILRLLGLLRELFGSADPAPAEFESLQSTLVALLHEHNLKEERILYPMTDSQVPPEQLRDLVAKMKAF